MPISGASGIGSASARQNGQLGRTNRELRKFLERLATAKRINRASDDAAGLSISEQLKSQVRSLKMASRNVDDAVSALRIADGGAGEIGEMLQRQRELSIQAGNATLSDTDRQALDIEFQQLTEEIQRIAGGTEFNRQEVADGTGLASGDAVVQAGANAEDQLNLPQVDLTSATLGLPSLSIASASGASAAISSLDTALDSVNGQRSTIGAMMNRLTSAGNNLQVEEANMTAAQSAIADQDMAAGLVELSRQQLLQEGGIKAFQRFNDINANHILALLR